MIKKFFYIFMPLLMFVAASLFSREVVDEIRTIDYTDEGPVLTLTSDIKTRLDITPRTIRDIVLENRMIDDARKFKLSVTEQDVERFFVEIQRNNNISRVKLETAMLEQGYTPEEGKEQMRRNHLIGQVTSVRTKSDNRMIIQKEDVEKYYAANPKLFEVAANYTLKQATVEDEADADRKFGAAELDALDWEDFLTISEDELDDSMKFITKEKIGTVVDREIDDGNLVLTRLTGKTEKGMTPMEDLYDQIVMFLSGNAFNEVKVEYETKLLNEASIRFTYPEDEVAVMGRLR